VRLTAHPASEFAPKISPDGKWVAFSASYDNNTDVYVVSIDGGQPKRLTWHPNSDIVNGWSVDGKRVLFASARAVANNRSNQLYEVALDGGFETKVMNAVAFEGSWSADGKRLAYRPYRSAYSAPSGWRQYRGGSTPPIWIIDPVSNAIEKLPHENASDGNPIWAGNEVLFLSDRNDGAVNLFGFNTQSKALRQLTKETLWDIRSASAYEQTVVYEVGGQLKELNTVTGVSKVLPIMIAADVAQLRPQWKDASKALTSAQLSATGKRVVISARGEVFTVPVKDGSPRNLTATSGVREKDALWSPDGKHIAYISDAGMQHSLVIRDQAGLDKPQTHALGKTGYFTLLAWSPNNQALVYQDNHLNLYAINIKSGIAKRLDTGLRRGTFNVSFSRDSRWLAYTLLGENYFSQIRLYDFNTGKSTTLTDGLSHADFPVFAASDYLYFTASINSGPAQVGLDMSTQERPLRSGIYAVVLAADGKSPLLPKMGDEGDADDKKAESKDAKESKDKKETKDKKDGKEKADAKSEEPPKPTKIDFDGIQQRIVALPVAERNYDSLAVAADGALFYLERQQPGVSIDPPEAEAENNAELYRFDFEAREAKSLKQGVANFSLSADGKKLLLRFAKGKLESGDAGEKLETKPIELSGLQVLIDPREEWRQIFDETWWMEKEFFYDPNLHGLNWQAIYDRYRPLLSAVQRREDLNTLLVEMIGELQVGHNRIGGGDVYQERSAKVGLLGADFKVENDRYRIVTLYGGDRWNPFLKAPLAAAGLGVKEGDYILAINGKALDGKQNLYALLENTVGKQVTLNISADVGGKGAHNITVEPIDYEAALRQWQWIEHNRQYVDNKSKGKVAYVYLPNTADEGFQYFNRMFFAQIDKPAVIIDERRNGGGQAANYITDVLSRRYLSGWKDRDGLVSSTPAGAIYGPKIMLIDQDAGSGGDFLPYAFKSLGLGTLVGKRTWGGLIGIAANPDLIDGGSLVVPFFRFFTPQGEWRVENQGVSPDIDVELEPDQVNKGDDTQLDRAIGEALQKLQTYQPIERKTAPPMPTQLGK
jgi:tricorn protease